MELKAIPFENSDHKLIISSSHSTEEHLMQLDCLLKKQEALDTDSRVLEMVKRIIS